MRHDAMLLSNMMRFRRVRHRCALLCATLAATWSAGAAESAAPPQASCSAYAIEYETWSRLKITNTAMGKADGIHEVRPGKVVLRTGARSGRPGGRVKLLQFESAENFSIKVDVLTFSMTAETRARTRATPDASGSAAEGILRGTELRWLSKVRGYRTDGTLTCTGEFCGKFGAPAAGTTRLDPKPRSIDFQSWVFSKDLKSFVMPFTKISHTASPSQTTFLEVNGREVKRTCVPRAARKRR